MKSTVTFPLHRSAEWIDTVAANIARVRPVARILVSDATEHDDTLARLRERLPGDDIEWVGRRDLAPGWVAHCNDLLARAQTPFVMWMPHDDDVDADWVTDGQAALQHAPDAVLALGRVEVERGDGGPDGALTLDPRLGDPDAAVRLAAAIGFVVDGTTSSLGVTFRALLRRELACPLPDVDPKGSWADLLWGIRMAARGHFVESSGGYLKRWHGANTHTTWSNLRLDTRLRAELIPDALADLDIETRYRVLAAAWADESARADATLTAVAEERRLIREERARIAEERARIAPPTARGSG